MAESEALRTRARGFAIASLKAVDAMSKRLSTEIVGKQFLRSATSIGANYRAACRARSKAEFIAKIHIVQEEADETQFWLELLGSIDALDPKELQKLMMEAKELTAIFTASEKAARLGIKG